MDLAFAEYRHEYPRTLNRFNSETMSLASREASTTDVGKTVALPLTPTFWGRRNEGDEENFGGFKECSVSQGPETVVSKALVQLLEDLPVIMEKTATPKKVTQDGPFVE